MRVFKHYFKGYNRYYDIITTRLLLQQLMEQMRAGGKNFNRNFFFFGEPLKTILSLNNKMRLLGCKLSLWRRKKGHFKNSHHNRVTQIPVNVCSNMLISVYRSTFSLHVILIPSDWPGQETKSYAKLQHEREHLSIKIRLAHYREINNLVGLVQYHSSLSL